MSDIYGYTWADVRRQPRLITDFRHDHVRFVRVSMTEIRDKRVAAAQCPAGTTLMPLLGGGSAPLRRGAVAAGRPAAGQGGRVRRVEPGTGRGDLEAGGGPGEPERGVCGVAGQIDNGEEGHAGRGGLDASDLTEADGASAGHMFYWIACAARGEGCAR
jgi:hypothetical protein